MGKGDTAGGRLSEAVFAESSDCAYKSLRIHALPDCTISLRRLILETAEHMPAGAAILGLAAVSGCNEDASG
jgi:predicted metal-dependent HD superfamily phosphohydrolase